MKSQIDLVDWIRIRKDIIANPAITIAELSVKHDILSAGLSRHLRSLGIRLRYGKKQVKTPCIQHDPDKDIDYKFDIHTWELNESREYEFGTREYGSKLRQLAWAECHKGKGQLMGIAIQTSIVQNLLIVKRVK